MKYDLRAPQISVTVDGPSTLVWQSGDEGTPWLKLVVRLAQGGNERLIKLGRRGLSGHVRLKLPAGRWHAALFASNSAGKVRYVPLGVLPR